MKKSGILCNSFYYIAKESGLEQHEGEEFMNEHSFFLAELSI